MITLLIILLIVSIVLNLVLYYGFFTDIYDRISSVESLLADIKIYQTDQYIKMKSIGNDVYTLAKATDELYSNTTSLNECLNKLTDMKVEESSSHRPNNWDSMRSAFEKPYNISTDGKKK